MQVFVKTVEGKTVTLSGLSTEDTVASLKAMVCDREGIPAGQQRVHFGGKLLQDGKTLGESGVERGSTVHVVLGLGGGLQKEQHQQKRVTMLSDASWGLGSRASATKPRYQNFTILDQQEAVVGGRRRRVRRWCLSFRGQRLLPYNRLPSGPTTPHGPSGKKNYQRRATRRAKRVQKEKELLRHAQVVCLPTPSRHAQEEREAPFPCIEYGEGGGGEGGGSDAGGSDEGEAAFAGDGDGGSVWTDEGEHLAQVQARDSKKEPDAPSDPGPKKTASLAPKKKKKAGAEAAALVKYAATTGGGSGGGAALFAGFTRNAPDADTLPIPAWILGGAAPKDDAVTTKCFGVCPGMGADFFERIRHPPATAGPFG